MPTAAATDPSLDPAARITRYERLFSDRGFSAGLVTQGAFQGSLAGFALVLTVYVQTGLGWSAIHAGMTLLPFSLGAFVA